MREALARKCSWVSLNRGSAQGGSDDVNLRRLQYFVKIVDIGSLTQAADILHVAQPALSQQLATLEGEVRQQLLLRTKRGADTNGSGKSSSTAMPSSSYANASRPRSISRRPARTYRAPFPSDWHRARPQQASRCRCCVPSELAIPAWCSISMRLMAARSPS